MSWATRTSLTSSQIIQGRVKDEDGEVVRCVKEDLKTVDFKYGLSDNSFKKMQVAQRAARGKRVQTPQQKYTKSSRNQCTEKARLDDCAHKESSHSVMETFIAL